MSYYDKYTDVTALRGKTMTAIEKTADDRIEISMSDGTRYALIHNQTCCESVSIHDIRGELDHLLGTPLTVATHESDSENWPQDVKTPEYLYSWTWTTFEFATERGSVAIRWLGESNGYYGEGVDIEEIASGSNKADIPSGKE